MSDVGFKFLLMDSYNQLWLLLREYVSSAGKAHHTCCEGRAMPRRTFPGSAAGERDRTPFI
jgi:hypothetical protein